jgi:hypothetical protein
VGGWGEEGQDKCSLLLLMMLLLLLLMMMMMLLLLLLLLLRIQLLILTQLHVMTRVITPPCKRALRGANKKKEE